MKLATTIFVVAFDMQETKQRKAPREAGQNHLFRILIQSFNNGNKTRILTNTVIATML